MSDLEENPTPWWSRGRRLTWVSAAVALLVYLAHAAVMGPWIVDDAGISFAYARNLVAGHGLVSQPGATPVEGFTNLLWVVVLAAPMILGIFDPVTTPKVLGAVFVFFSFLATASLITTDGRRPALLAVVALCLTAGITGFTIWCSSGLENALYALTLAGLAITARGTASVSGCVTAGVVLFLAFCTRPDAALYFGVIALVIGWRISEAPVARRTLAFLLGFGLPWSATTAFRWFYFQDVMPNTFYAKQGEGVDFFLWLVRDLDPWLTLPATIVLGAVAMLLVAALLAGLGRLLGRYASQAALERSILTSFFLCSIAVYFTLRGDWMGEYRFATPAFLFGPAAILCAAWDLSPRPAWRPVAVSIFAVLMLAGVARYSLRHTPAFAASPTLSLQKVRQTSNEIADAMAEEGSLPRAALLTPDIGGALWEDRFEVLDLVGLVDREIARAHVAGGSSLRDYLLEGLRPDGMWLHSNWYGVFKMGTDPEFLRLYSTVWEERPDPGQPPVRGLYRLSRQSSP